MKHASSLPLLLTACGLAATATRHLAQRVERSTVPGNPVLPTTASACAPSWVPTFPGPQGPDGEVDALAVYDDGSGPALYVGGHFMTVGGVFVRNLAKWDGSGWSSVAGGMNSVVYALATFDDGSGLALYAGGDFTTAGGVPANRIARWNGSGWSPLGSGMSGAAFAMVQTLAVHDDGSGPALYAGGYFTTAGGLPASRVAKWDGTSWSALGSGMNNAVVFALAEYDDGQGPALFAGGDFTTAGGVPASRIARWDGTSWSALGSGMETYVYALTAYDDGRGPALYAAGRFLSAGGVSARRLARWDGSSWSALGSGANSSVRALTVHDDGSGPALYAGGSFYVAGDLVANRIARWDGSNWSALGNGMDGTVLALTGHNGGAWPALFAGGSFTSCLDSGDSHMARWTCQEQLLLDFETEDDLTTPLRNGQELDTEFGRLVRISGAGANAGPTVFDSTPGGPNDPALDRDLLIGHGNLLLLEDDRYSLGQAIPGVFDVVTDDPDGGDLIFDFLQPVNPQRVLMADINPPPNQGASVTLIDAHGRARVYTVEPGWTGGYGNAGPWPLDLTTTEPQPGNGTARFATATQAPDFQQGNVVRLVVHLTGFGAIDDLGVCLSSVAQAARTPRIGARRLP